MGFFSAFSGTLLFVTLGALGTQRWPKGEVWGGRFEAISGAWPTCENRGFM